MPAPTKKEIYTITDRKIENRVKKLQDIEAQQNLLEIGMIRLFLAQDPVDVHGGYFVCHGAGETFFSVHPFTGEKYQVTIKGCERQKLRAEHFQMRSGAGTESPSWFTVISYTLSPDLSSERFSVRDCRESDAPRVRVVNGETESLMPVKSMGPSSIGIIGHVSGTVSIITEEKEQLVIPLVPLFLLTQTER